MFLPKDYTQQENFIADYLSEFGFRYDQQVVFAPYTVDFYIPELCMVIEADGIYGHFRKRDAKRDDFLSEQAGIDYVVHIKESTKEKIKEILWQELNKLNAKDQKEELHKTIGS
tara:strand:+ start:482 stop:823 length:342 start_codon:yes stop_codon:yes gene_type:complete